jgi:hypothetical protein
MATIDKRLLKAYIRLDGSHRAVQSSLIRRKSMPKVGRWIEVDAYECCNNTTTPTTTQYCEGPLCNTVLAVGTPDGMTFGYYNGVFGSINPDCSNVLGLYWSEGTPNTLQLYVGANYGESVIIEIDGSQYLLSALGAGPPFWYYFATITVNPFPAEGQSAVVRICGEEVTTTTTTTTLLVPSDINLKDNIRMVEGKVGQFNMYTWTWNEEAVKYGYDKYPNTGVIAQEVAKVYPDAVILDTITGYLKVDYNKIPK